MKSETFNNISNQYELKDYNQIKSNCDNCSKYINKNKEVLCIYDFTDANSSMVNDLIYDMDNENINICVYKDVAQEEKVRKGNSQLLDYDVWTYYDDNSPIIIKTFGVEESYLDYNKHLVYNISISEVLKLYNRIKYKIFDYNVRSYLGKSKDSDLKKRFNEYLYNYLKTAKSDLTKHDYFKDVDKDSEYYPELFWACHNGITICSDDFYIKFKNIHFSPANTYILNGAQTLSVFNNIVEEFQKKVNDDIINSFLESIIIKVILLKEDKIRKVKLYSVGLNTQKPITDYTILAVSKEATEINSLLSDFRIVKDGDSSRDKVKMNVLSFVKSVLIINQKPEKAKNYPSKDLQKDFETIYKDISDGKITNLNDKLLICKKAKDFFVNYFEKDTKESYSDNERAISSYGVNYFQSYCIKENIDKINDKVLSDFIDIITIYCSQEKKTLNINDFKNYPDNQEGLYSKIFCNKKED